MAKSANFVTTQTQLDHLHNKNGCFLVHYIKIEPHESAEALWKKGGVFF